MHGWMKISIFTSMFGFLKELQPSEPFLINFLMENRNVTIQQANQLLFPAKTYAYTVALVIVLLISDYLLYKPLIIMVGISGSVVYILFTSTTPFWTLQLAEVFYGIYGAVDVAYCPYIYAKVDQVHYSIVTGHLRSGEFTGNFIGSGFGQLCIYYEWVSYLDLNYYSLGFQVACTFWALLLPAVERPPSEATNEEAGCCKQISSTLSDTAKHHYTNFKSTYSNPSLVPWCIWFACAWGCNVCILEYRQLMWKKIVPDPIVPWNGAVEAILKLVCAIFSFLTGYIYSSESVQRMGLYILAVISLICGGFILLMCLTDIIWYSFTGFILFNSFLSINLTIASTEIAKQLKDNSFGLVFGLNALLAVLIKSIITAIFINAFKLSVVHQFITFAICYILLGTAFLIFSILKSVRTMK